MINLELLDPAISVQTGAEISEKHHVDWTFVNHCEPDAVLTPTSTLEVAAILKHCHAQRQPVVVQGGLTGLAGGATPSTGEVALSLEKFSGIEEIDEQAMTLTAKSGTTLQTIQEAAEAKGLIFPMDIGARGSATIGGNVSTNAGGVQVIRYGMTRALIMGIEVVLADGTIISSLNKMLKNNAGYDLKHLFIGAEGTLGVVTKVVVRLFPKPKSRCTALVAFNQFADSVKLLKETQSNLTGLVSSFEVMWDSYFDNVVPSLKSFTNPFTEKHAAYAIVEISGNHQQRDTELFEEFLVLQSESGIVKDVVLAQNDSQADNIWSIRHAIGDFGSSMPVINYDVSIPIGDMDSFTNTLNKKLDDQYPHITKLLFGHIGDSNLHVVIGDYRDAEFAELKDLVHQLTGDYNGSVSAEHGIGKLKTNYLKLSRSEQEITLMRLLKKSLDPHNILNPGRVVAA